MKNFRCGHSENYDILNDFYECGTCGNHICKTQVETCGGVCPNCFGRLYRVN